MAKFISGNVSAEVVPLGFLKDISKDGVKNNVVLKLTVFNKTDEDLKWLRVDYKAGYSSHSYTSPTLIRDGNTVGRTTKRSHTQWSNASKLINNVTSQSKQELYIVTKSNDNSKYYDSYVIASIYGERVDGDKFHNQYDKHHQGGGGSSLAVRDCKLSDLNGEQWSPRKNYLLPGCVVAASVFALAAVACVLPNDSDKLKSLAFNSFATLAIVGSLAAVVYNQVQNVRKANRPKEDKAAPSKKVNDLSQ